MALNNQTRGGLAPAKITNLATDEVVYFMFNPYEYTIKKTNTWDKKAVVGKNLPQVTFQQGGAPSLSLTLHFDSQPKSTDVRQYTDKLWAMMLVDEREMNQRSGKSAPPPVAFEWGHLYFKAIITSMSQKFTLFDEKGVPLRCTVDVTLEQFLDENSFPPQVAGQGAGQSAPTTATVVEGQRLDHIAADNGGNPADQRQIAEANNIDNPQRIPPGTNLNVPPS